MSDVKIPILNLQEQYRNLKDEIQAAVNGVLDSGQFILGPEVSRFEQEVAEYLGTKHAIGVNSGTDALIIGLRALGIGPGDEVISTPFSFFATAESISNVGAKPVFADIDAATFNIDPAGIEAKIGPRTKAIMPVHLYGNPAAMAAILQLAEAHKLKVIEDCAQSFGARYAGGCRGCDDRCDDKIRSAVTGKQTGSMGHVGAFSFFPTKNLGAYGDAGLISTNDDGIAELARKLRVHGGLQRYRNEMLGYNSRLDSLQAAILRVKLNYIDAWNQQRRAIAQRYSQLLADVAGVLVPALEEGHVFHQYTVRILDGKRDAVRQFLCERGIASMVYYPIPQDRLPVYEGQYPANVTSDRVGKQVLSLPIYPELKFEHVDWVAMAIAEAMRSLP
ncbi:DegT/DnrJ/EryC1/StrS aminotransferase family protein [Synechococcus sp. PCC 7336]|uniref:DegT/DnrJ/EryC1/StrS family aminotransferase n=1 Tax=Synechococcus sp. PCC 7336 TaxID=195250 RepID=UPI000348166A|nr:DegT/DnrJ/EryC1/StrS family aminotransferase [Synechococcus sp. PCC 7336]